MSITKTALTMIGLAMAGAAVAGMIVNPKKEKPTRKNVNSDKAPSSGVNLWV